MKLWATAIGGLTCGLLLGIATVWMGSATRPRLAADLLLAVEQPVSDPEPSPASPNSVDEPQALKTPGPLAADAAESRAALENDDAVRGVIDRELPAATPEERQIWFEELRRLPPAAVADMLRIRRQFYSIRPFDLDAAPAEPAPTQPAQTTADATLAQLVANAYPESWDAMQRRREVLLQNLVHADALGYRRVIPRIVPSRAAASPDGGGHGAVNCQWAGTQLDLQAGPLLVTHRRLDVAVLDEHWLLVKSAEGPAVTRYGHLELNDARQLSIRLGGQLLPLDPPLAIPAGVNFVDIDEKAVVWIRQKGRTLGEKVGVLPLARFFDAAALELRADGCYTPTEASGPPQLSDPATTPLRVGVAVLEHSNVNVEIERRELEAIEEWLHNAAALAKLQQSAHPAPPLLSGQ